MRGLWAVAKREIRGFFLSPAAWVILTAWLLWCGASFWLLSEYYAGQTVAGAKDTPLSAFFGNTVLFFMPLLVFAPLLTMRLVAEERRSGTLENVMTTPVSETAYVLGKYAAAMLFWAFLWAPTVLYVWITRQYGSIDGGAVLSSYLGILLIGGYYMAVGLLMSALSPTPIIAAAGTFFVLGALFVFGIGEFVLEGRARELSEYVSVWGHMSDFSKGIVDTRYIVFDLSIAVIALVAAVIVLISRRRA